MQIFFSCKLYKNFKKRLIILSSFYLLSSISFFLLGCYAIERVKDIRSIILKDGNKIFLETFQDDQVLEYNWLGIS